MLHHVSFTAQDPRHVAAVLAGLLGGRVVPFGPRPGAYIAMGCDGAGTAIEVYPAGTELHPDPQGPARFEHNYFAQKLAATHAAVSVSCTEQQVRTVAQHCGWQVQRLDRGGFDVLELWIENRVMLELMTPSMLNDYLAVVGAPRIGAAGDSVERVDVSVRVEADPDAAWRAWTDEATLRHWWGLAEAHVDLRIGGAYELTFPAEDAAPPRDTMGCRVLSYVPGRVLSFTWSSPEHPDLGREHTWVVVTFTESHGGTEVSLSHCGFQQGPAWDGSREYARDAWPTALLRFQSYWQTAANGEPGDLAVVDLREAPIPNPRTDSVAARAD